MSNPIEPMSPEVELAVETALDAMLEAVYVAAPWLPRDGGPVEHSVRVNSRKLISAGLGFAGSAYAVLRVGNRNDAMALADAVIDVVCPQQQRTETDVCRAAAVIARMAQRAAQC
jgi:hypothetical protein